MSQVQVPPFVNIYTEASPNPESLKFVTNFMLIEDGKGYDFTDLASAERSPLAKMIFEQGGVQRVFIMNNFITVTKNADITWHEIQQTLRDNIKKYLEEKQPILLPETQTEDNEEGLFNPEDAETVAQIKGILDEYIKPAVESDGGAINFHSFYDGVVKVELRGSCSGCPASVITLKSGIENLLKRMIPAVQSVESV